MKADVLGRNTKGLRSKGLTFETDETSAFNYVTVANLPYELMINRSVNKSIFLRFFPRVELWFCVRLFGYVKRG